MMAGRSSPGHAVAYGPADDESRQAMVIGPRHAIPTAALIVSVLAATAIMVSPLTPWTTAVVGWGAATVFAGTAVLILWLLRRER